MPKKTNDKKYWVGVDLGGTKMLVTLLDQSFRPCGRKRRKTRAQSGKDAGLARMTDTIQAALDDAGVASNQLAGIGVGCPGPLDLDAGIVLEMPNLGWKRTPVRSELEDVFDCPAVVMNDVDAGVYGEYRFGAARDVRSVVGVFPGTGIGGGCVYEGSVLRGRKGSCMEIGHVPVDPQGSLCGCGQRGCLEAMAGRLAISAAAAAAAYRGEAPNLLAAAGTDLSNIRSGVLAASVEAGDEVVERILRDAARLIGWTCAGVVNLLAPDRLVLGGGLVEALPDLFREEVDRSLRARVMPAYRDTFTVVVAKLGDDATAIGAAAWAEHSQQ
ncbi:MAG: ROK family protein [Chromatiaceae bacterium]|nr:ROK family protein [Chromatiaceae bacterium]